jgi:carboxyl-terminal processing protease
MKNLSSLSLCANVENRIAMNHDNNRDSRPRPRLLRPVFLLSFVFVFGLGVGMLFDRWSLRAFVPSDAVSNFRLIAQAWNTIERFYVDRSALNPQNLTYGAISGMVDALGDTGHSVFLTPAMVKELHVTETGELKGVGVQVQVNTNRQVVIVAPIDNSPAQRAGLHSGEIILSVNGRAIAGMPLNEAVAQIAGKVGTPVELGILDPKTHEVRNVTIVRAEIKLHDVTWAQLPGTSIADIRLASFNEGVAKDLRTALRQIQAQRLQGLILDLRENPGGVLDEGVTVASQFLASGNVLLVKNATGEITSIPVEPGGLATNLPMAVLIDHGSASAAEIVASALGDAHRAELIGETTFGTGTVLNEFPLPGGSAILLAIQEWLTPGGQSFWHKGVSPQVSVDIPSDVFPLRPPDIKQMTPDQLQTSPDKQLLQALQVVQQQMNGAGEQK